MTTLPENLRYTDGHVWLRQDEDGLYTLGLTEHGQSLLGDLVFVQLPEVGARIDKDGVLAALESVKSAWDVQLPVDVEVVEVNSKLADNPELINEQPFGEGWIVRLRALESMPDLLDAQAYRALIGD